LTAQQAALAEERRQRQVERDEIQQGVDKQQAQIDAQLAALEAERNTLTTQRDALQAERNAVAEERRQREHRRAELPQSEQPVAKTEPELPATPESPEPQFHEPTPHAPVDLNDVFRRIGAKVDLSEVEPVPQAPPPIVPSPVAAGNGPRHATAAPATKDGDEESIDDYMSRLMQRIRLTPNEPESPSRATPRPEPIHRAREASAGGSAVEPLQPAASTPQSVEAEPVQLRARTPAKQIDLTAFRELANLSARNALHQHSRRTLVHAMYSKLTVSMVALVAGIGLFWMWKQFGACPMTLCSSLVAIIVALFWGLEYALLTGRLIVRKGHVSIDQKASSHPSEPAASSGEDADAAHSTADHIGRPAEES
jgi:hypothetical protein